MEKKGIEHLIAIQNIVYSTMAIIPYVLPNCSNIISMSQQQRRLYFSEILKNTVFMSGFVDFLETEKKSVELKEICNYYISKEDVFANIINIA